MVRALVVAAVVLIGLGALFFALRPDSTPGGSEERTVEVEIAAGEMDPREVSVSEGDIVTLRFASDEPVEVHVHGYDIEEEVSPGEATEVRFEADLTGRFEIEDHETEAVLGALLVRPR